MYSTTMPSSLFYSCILKMFDIMMIWIRVDIWESISKNIGQELRAVSSPRTKTWYGH